MSPRVPLTVVPFTLKSSSDDLIYGDIRFLDDDKRKPVIIICHSFMAFKDWGFFPHIGVVLAEAGFMTIIFNFSHNGISGNYKKIWDYEKFSSNTFSKELEDLQTIVHAVKEEKLAGGIGDVDKIALLGHSRGGGDAIVYAASDRNIRGLVTLSAVATFDRWTDHQKKQWELNGFLPLAKDQSVSPLRLGKNLLDDLNAHHAELDILQAASRVAIPWLIVHGKADITVPSIEAEKLYSASNKSSTELLMFDHVGHLYNAASPQDDHYVTLNHVLHVTSGWLKNHLT